MKKLILLSLSVLALNLQAQESETKREIFNIAVRGGANFANFSSIEADTKTAFYLGVSIPLEFTKFYTLNPEFNYSAQGANNIKYYSYDYTTDTYSFKNQDISANYLSINIINRFTAKKAFIELGPGLDFIINKKNYNENGVDLTFNIGLGYNITEKLAIQGRFKKGIIPAIDNYNDANYYSRSYDGFNQVFSLGVQYKL